MVQQGPPEMKVQLATKSLWARLRQYSDKEVESTLRRLLANGEIADYDDEIANRMRDAADLCAAVRELTGMLLKQ